MHTENQWRRMYTCPVCPANYVTLKAKKAHVRNKHGDTKKAKR